MRHPGIPPTKEMYETNPKDYNAEDEEQHLHTHTHTHTRAGPRHSTGAILSVTTATSHRYRKT
jgi:hypothetical protein